MRAVVLHEYGDANRLRYEEVPTPQPGPGKVLVRLIATSVNPIDWKIRSGAAKDRMPVEFPFIPGRDLSGEVVKVGAGVSALEPGQKVLGLTDRTYAEFIVADASALTILPEGLEAEQAGALPLVLTTGAQLVEHLHPKSGQTILITGALGSVGRTAVFVAQQYGARVLAGVRSNQKKETEQLGVSGTFALDDNAEIEGLPTLDAIGDTVDHDVIGKVLSKLRSGGILGSVLGKPAAANGRDIHVEAFMAVPDPDRLQQLARAIQRHEFHLPIAKTYKLAEAALAQEFAEGGGAKGKVLLVP